MGDVGTVIFDIAVFVVVVVLMVLALQLAIAWQVRREDRRWRKGGKR